LVTLERFKKELQQLHARAMPPKAKKATGAATAAKATPTNVAPAKVAPAASIDPKVIYPITIYVARCDCFPLAKLLVAARQHSAISVNFVTRFSSHFLLRDSGFIQTLGELDALPPFYHLLTTQIGKPCSQTSSTQTRSTSQKGCRSLTCYSCHRRSHICHGTGDSGTEEDGKER
jgi:hypothetical protein